MADSQALTRKTINDRASRLKAAREKAGYRSASAFALKHGFNDSGYRHHENGTRGYQIEIAKAYAPLLGVTWQWLMDGGEMPDLPAEKPARNLSDLAHEPLTETVINIHQMPRDIPILGSAACGEDGLFEFNGQILDHARRPARLQNVKDAYALFASGLSMSPWREPGQLVYVHPHQPPKVGDYVVVQLVPERPGETPGAYIKKLVRRTEKELRLLQYQPREEVSIPMKKVKTIHRVIDWDELLGL